MLALAIASKRMQPVAWWNPEVAESGRRVYLFKFAQRSLHNVRREPACLAGHIQFLRPLVRKGLDHVWKCNASRDACQLRLRTPAACFAQNVISDFSRRSPTGEAGFRAGRRLNTVGVGRGGGILNSQFLIPARPPGGISDFGFRISDLPSPTHRNFGFRISDFGFSGRPPEEFRISDFGFRNYHRPSIGISDFGFRISELPSLIASEDSE